MLITGVSQAALAIARENQFHGGILLHGALAKFPSTPSGQKKERGADEGVILAGPSAVGKTTASSRLPSSWCSLSDDTTLVVKDSAGRYWAHPWPTWSRFYETDGIPGPGGSWDVQEALPLRAIFFLSQSSENKSEPIGTTPAAALLMGLVRQVSGLMTRFLQVEEARSLFLEQLTAVESIVRTIPAYTLHFSLAGKFWEEMERVLQKNELQKIPPASQSPAPFSREADNWTNELQPENQTLQIVYSGPSMNPTLREPDLLSVESYEGRPIKCGDVIYFKSPENDHNVVHRVIGIASKGICTRGDNNAVEDPYILQPDDVTGRVSEARRRTRPRRIAGGYRGVLIGYYNNRIRRIFILIVLRLLHGLYEDLANAGLFRKLLPFKFRPRVYVFKSGKSSFFKLLMGKRVIGNYNEKRQQWLIKRPYRLFINKAELPDPQKKKTVRSKVRRDSAQK
ncbi:MAG: SynChlorMet cassette protein ScmC [bacterium]|nr:SynChlorMet cassette protein ScmC [bacterium]